MRLPLDPLNDTATALLEIPYRLPCLHPQSQEGVIAKGQTVRVLLGA